MSAKMTLEERKVKVLIKLRGYKLIKRQEQKDAISFIIKMPRENKKALLWCIPTKGTVGVAYANQLDKAMREAEVDNGIIVTSEQAVVGAVEAA